MMEGQWLQLSSTLYLAIPSPYNVFENTDLKCLKAWIIAAVKNINAPITTRVWQEFEYRIDVCRGTRGAHIEIL
jgi:hypothetical protein